MSAQRENYRYDASGLSGITLAVVEVRRCAECGEHEVVIPSIEELHRSIAKVLISKPERLAPAEIRFLRKYLGLSGADFAAHLRLMVVTRDPVRDYSLEALRTVARREPRQVRVRLRQSGREWRAA